MDRINSFIKRFWEGFINNNLTQIGAQLAFFLILAFFPFFIFLLNVLSFTPLGSTSLLNDIYGMMPLDTVKIVKPIVSDIVNNSNPTLLSISLLLALWSGSNGINNLVKGIKHIFGINQDPKAVFIDRILSILYTIVLVIIIIVMLITQVFKDKVFALLVRWLGNSVWLDKLALWFSSLLPFVFLVLIFALLFFFTLRIKKRHRISFTAALLGGAISSLGWMLTSMGFNYYVNNFGNFAKTYGSLGGIMVFLIWLWLSAIAIMIGALVVAIIQPKNQPATETSD